ncbi:MULTISPECIES: hypothetical protein [unclassified Microcoleus]|uniref:hypothetical protein n=1 Tax=unclassified Microcoleus TaxID=2642155 RepID=UPI0025FB5BA8|nr:MULTISPECIES: hypothetical protein [unclassified Microcoleus]
MHNSLPITDYQLLITNSQLLITFENGYTLNPSASLTASCQLSTENCQLSTVNCQLSTQTNNWYFSCAKR